MCINFQFPSKASVFVSICSTVLDTAIVKHMLTTLRHTDIQCEGHEGQAAQNNRIIVVRTKFPILHK